MILITQPRVGSSHNEILALHMAAREMGWDVLPAPSSWRLDEDLIKSGVKGVPYGSQTFCEVIAQQMGWTLKQNRFDWLAKLPKKYTKRQVDFMTLGEARNITDLKFIKPADDKCFDAKVYPPGTFNPSRIIQDDYPVLVSEIVHFTSEYRCFVNETDVLTWSNYIWEKHIAEPKYYKTVPSNLGPDGIDPNWFVANMLRDCLVNHNLETVPSVVDVGFIEGKGWAIIETNQCWASGLYGCDPMEALKVMEKACERIS